MKKSTKKLIWTLILLTLIAIPVTISTISKLREKRAAELEHQKVLAEERAKKEAEEKAKQKIYIMGKFEPSERTDFVTVPKEYNIGGYTMYLRQETLDAFLRMKSTAEEDGITLKIASATRNFNYQKNIWNNKWNGFVLVNGKNLTKSIPDGLLRFKKILEYSAAPGTSRHHWGTDIDINNANAEYFKTSEGIKTYDWLVRYAYKFGFCQPYTEKGEERKTGYNEEKWHWSYTPLAQVFTEQYKNLVKEEDIVGFQGAENVPQLNLIGDYVLGVNPECI